MRNIVFKIAALSVCTVLILSGSQILSEKCAKETDPAETEREDVNTTFLVKVYKDKIGIFENNSSTPNNVIEVPFKVLPKKDGEALSKGIKVTGAEGLRHLIEDLTG